jgi:hypothetical protein
MENVIKICWQNIHIRFHRSGIPDWTVCVTLGVHCSLTPTIFTFECCILLLVYLTDSL